MRLAGDTVTPVYRRGVRVVVVPWSARWSIEFEAVRRELSEACSSIPVRSVEHVGSTSVPGLASKPILDVAVVVASDDVHAAIAALERVGYRHLGERGIPDRHAFSAPAHGPARHVYVTVDGSLALRNQLAVRDVLRRDPNLRRRYGELKLALASRDTDDMDAYVAAKSPVLQEVLRASGRFTASELETIAALNDVSGSG
ncbi:MAG: GrpB family protein [Acidimicrobiales bacterium]|nr:GrpB family protein [Acidimicrobiales bacterium]